MAHDAPVRMKAMLLAFLLWTVAPRQYIDEALFRPSQFGVQVWPKMTDHGVVRRGLGHDVETRGVRFFNAGLSLLPSNLASRLNATFLTSLKQRLCQCELLEVGETDFPRVPKEFPIVSFPTLATLDRELRVVKVFNDIEWNASAWHKSFWAQAMDVRIEAKPGYGDALLLHSCAWYAPEPHYRYAFSWLKFSRDESPFVEHLRHPDVANPPTLRDFGQNFGVLWNGGHRHRFELIHWLSSQGALDVRVGVPPKPCPHCGRASNRQPVHATLPGRQALSGRTPRTERSGTQSPAVVGQSDDMIGPPPDALYTNGLEGNLSRPIHLNGSPVSLEAVCSGVSLLVGHSHLDAVLPSHQLHEAVRGTTRWGNTYLTRLFAVNSTSRRVIAASPSFCFPSANDHEACDLIQFVTQVVQAPHKGGEWEEPSLIFAIGINDCETETLEVPVSHVLRQLGLCSDLGDTDSRTCDCGLPRAGARRLHNRTHKAWGHVRPFAPDGL